MSMTVARFLSRGAAHRPRAADAPVAVRRHRTGGFAFLLGVTWSFRGTAQKYARPVPHGGYPGRPDADPAHPEDDEAHWPDHPGHGHP